MVYRSERITPIGLGKQAIYGAAPTAGGQTIWPEIVQSTEGLFDEIDWKEIRARGGDRELYQIVEGKHSAEGTINGLIQSGRWIAMCMGKDVVTGAGPFTHTITPKNGMPFPVWDLELKYVDTTSLSAYIKSMAVDSLRLSGAEEDLLKFSASIKAHSSVKNVGADSTVTPITTEPYKFHQGTFTYFGSAFARVVDFDATINNGGNLAWYYDTSATVGKFPKEYVPGPVSYSLKTTATVQDTTVFDNLVAAANSVACTILFTRGADTLTLAFTNCVLKSAPHPIPEEGEVRVPLDFIPRNLTATLVTGDSGSYADTS